MALPQSRPPADPAAPYRADGGPDGARGTGNALTNWSAALCGIAALALAHCAPIVETPSPEDQATLVQDPGDGRQVTSGTDERGVPRTTNPGSPDSAGLEVDPSQDAIGNVPSGSSPAFPAGSAIQAPGVDITQIAIYQGVKRTLMKDGEALMSSRVPLVPGRDALVRVFYRTTSQYDGLDVVARLQIGRGTPIERRTRIASSSSDATLESTINLDVPGDLLKGSLNYSVELLQEHRGRVSNSRARFPSTGTQGLPLSGAARSLRVTLVPFAYTADGTGRLPDTSDVQLTKYKNRFYAMYPVSDVELNVHAPVELPYRLYNSGPGWEDTLNYLLTLRAKDRAATNEYYFGIFEPAETFSEYCGGACVAGLGPVAGSKETSMRGAIGVGFSGDISTEAAVHEIGHTHGRQHAPCGGAAAIDPGFPYTGGSVGEWGYDLITKELHSPEKGRDLMGYCHPIWVSDYTFGALFQRIQGSASGSASTAAYTVTQEPSAEYERVLVRSDGSHLWDSPLALDGPPSGDTVPVDVVTQDGSSANVRGHFVPFDHLPGGFLLFPKTRAQTTHIRFSLAGKMRSVARQALIPQARDLPTLGPQGGT